MKYLISIMVSLLFLAGARESFAEGRCPDGYFPIGGGDAGWEGCAPMGPTEDEGPTNDVAGPQWVSRWGAIATADGALGVAKNAVSRGEAVSLAIAQCEMKSPHDQCSERAVYFDQCVALAWGDTMNVASRSPDIADAERSALEGCGEKTANCRIFYSACSYPERVR
jgi:hypothetical protein